ncbi:Heat shock 70 kDa protein [Aphelenchoides fujianensis]|nr:Heat shock 70 kDa protein [Aphelenchoides fujianensis]
MSANDHFGVDFGCSNVRAADYRRNDLLVIADQNGRKAPDARLRRLHAAGPADRRGRQAAGSVESRPTPSSRFKRMIGRPQSIGALDRSLWPWKPVVENADLRYEVESEHETARWLAADLAALMFAQMRVDIQRYARFSPQKVVLTVPVAFTQEQRQKLRIAASSVGLHVLRVESDLVAAAVLLGMDKQNCTDLTTSLIVDCGGGSTSAGVVSRQNGVSILQSHLFDELPEEQRAAVTKNPAARWLCSSWPRRRRFRLSRQEHDRVQHSNLLPGFHLDTQITRDRFEQLCDDLFGEVVKLAF